MEIVCAEFPVNEHLYQVKTGKACCQADNYDP